jgi:hypothetical protein
MARAFFPHGFSGFLASRKRPEAASAVAATVAEDLLPRIKFRSRPGVFSALTKTPRVHTPTLFRPFIEGRCQRYLSNFRYIFWPGAPILEDNSPVRFMRIDREPNMRAICLVGSLFLGLAAFGAELESRVLTHYVPQDFLETVVRREGWTELPLNLKGGVRKGDVVRIWAGGLIDRGNGDQPGENVAGPSGPATTGTPADRKKFALSPDAGNAFALLFKTETTGLKK